MERAVILLLADVKPLLKFKYSQSRLADLGKMQINNKYNYPKESNKNILCT